MIKPACIAAVVASLAVPALAKPHCAALDKTKFPNGAKFIALTSGQTHFAQGAFTAVPPIGPPPGDGAMLIQIPNEKGSAIAFTLGKLACQVMGVGPDFVKVLLKVGTGPLDAAGEEM